MKYAICLMVALVLGGCTDNGSKQKPRKQNSIYVKVDNDIVIRCIKLGHGISCDWNHPIKQSNKENQ